MAVDDQAHRVLAAPISNVELSVVAFIGYAAYEDGIVLSTQLVGEHLGERRGNSPTPSTVVKKAIRDLRPFQDDVRTLMGVKGDEALVEFETFPPPERLDYFNACLAQITCGYRGPEPWQRDLRSHKRIALLLFLQSNRRKAASCRNESRVRDSHRW